MGRVRVVAPGSDRIDISDGDWVMVKRELNTGDAKKLEAAGLKPPVLVDGRIVTPIDWGVYEMERAMVFLTDWSLQDVDGNKMPLTMDSIKALDVPTFNEVNKVILDESAKRLEEKKSQAETAKAKLISVDSVPEQTSV